MCYRNVLCILFIAVLSLVLFTGEAYAPTKIAPTKAEAPHPFVIIDTPEARLVDGTVALFKTIGSEATLPLEVHDSHEFAKGILPEGMMPGEYTVFAQRPDGVEFEISSFTVLGDVPGIPGTAFVSCSLEYIRGEKGNDCAGWNLIDIIQSGGGPGNEVAADLLALDTEGEELSSLPVQDGDIAHLASRLDPADYVYFSNKNSHKVFAPVPLLRVTADDGVKQATAYCSNIPYLDVVKPSGEVISTSDSNTTDVLAAIPLVDPETLDIHIDGVDILSGLGIDPSTDFPGGPFAGTVDINGIDVDVSDLIVDSAPISIPSTNSITMKLFNLDCGEHIILVKGLSLPGALSDAPADACNVDDISDANVFLLKCSEEWDPVCGVDGVTYRNACEARCAHVEIDYPGECVSPPECTTDDECAVNEICESGLCIPCICPAVWDPVCGVDGVTYGNACEARCAHVEIDYPWECVSPPECTTDDECAVNEICESGLCIPCICIDVWEPVCGVDGVTYGNACEARCAHIGIENPGECAAIPLP